MKYLFTVRTGGFGDPIWIDAFLPITVDERFLDPQVAIAMKELGSLKIDDELSNLQSAVFAMEMRLRFNNDMYPSVLMVTTEVEIDRDGLEEYLRGMSNTKLKKFMKESEL